ncbi:MFS transporter [Caballeronia ptereochthonis]|uniref:Major facilitator transporter n=1 Tax=Caballeronia ptereochthonis TaxID=1777144 RepID=A0A158AGB4_9BURK|nr:MFS transporter [Caballeronia ptereochthonis]SAK56790.1 major facilitator transporter [Caballeronia ptereochthonis]
MNSQSMRPARTHVQRMVLALLCAMSFILYLDRVNLAAAAGPIKAELGLSNTTLGIAFSAFGYTYAIFQIIGGWLADRMGARRTLLICGSIWVVATIATGLVGGLASLCAARLLLGIGEGAALPAQARAIANWFQTKDRGFVQGITHSSSRLGNAVAPALVALLATLYSWRLSFIIVGVLTAAWIVVWVLYYRDDPRAHRGINDTELALLPAQIAGQSQTRTATPWRRILGRMSPSIFVYFCQVWSNTLFFSWVPLYFLHGYGLNLKESAIFSSGVFLAGVVGDVLGGLLSDRVLKRTGSLKLARQGVIALSLIGAFVFMIPVMMSRDLTVVTTCLSGAFFMLELTIGPIWAVPMDVAPQHAGTASGTLNTGAALATIISPVVFGAVIDATGNWSLPFAGSLLFLLLGTVMTLKIRPDRSIDARSEVARLDGESHPASGEPHVKAGR